MTSDSKAPVTDEQRAREQFEAWWWKRHPDYTSELLKRTSKSGAYDSDWVNGMWLAWSAATENLAALLASRALEEAKWWRPKAYIGHRYDCSLDSTHSPAGDFCDCDRKEREREVDERIRGLAAACKAAGGGGQ